MRGWLRLVPLAVMTLGLTWSGVSADARASGESTATAAPALPEAPMLPAAIASDAARPLPHSDFRYASLRRH